MCVLFAATYPERTSALVLYGTYAARLRAPDYPWGPTAERARGVPRARSSATGADRRPGARCARARRDDARFRQWWAATHASRRQPGGRARADADERRDRRPARPAGDPRPDAGPAPHRRPDGRRRGTARYLAAHIPGAKYVELPGRRPPPVRRAIRTPSSTRSRSSSPARATPPSPTACSPRSCSPTSSARPSAPPRSATAAGASCSTPTTRPCAASWRASAAARSTPPATASWPRSTARPAPSAAPWRSREAVRALGLEVRAGLHTGEVELMGDDIGGIAVHIGARVAAEAGAGEVLVSQHGQGPGGRLRHRVRGSRRPHAQGRPGRVAAVRRRVGLRPAFSSAQWRGSQVISTSRPGRSSRRRSRRSVLGNSSSKRVSSTCRRRASSSGPSGQNAHCSPVTRAIAAWTAASRVGEDGVRHRRVGQHPHVRLDAQLPEHVHQLDVRRARPPRSRRGRAGTGRDSSRAAAGC